MDASVEKMIIIFVLLGGSILDAHGPLNSVANNAFLLKVDYSEASGLEMPG